MIKLLERRSILVRGIVQGVGFRPFVHGLALRLGLAGFVANHSGAVEIEVEGDAASLTAFEQALIYLNGLPLTSEDIRTTLEAAGTGWLQMLADVRAAQSAGGPQRLASLERLAQDSEALLDVFERLSDYYERSMQTLVGS